MNMKDASATADGAVSSCDDDARPSKGHRKTSSKRTWLFRVLAVSISLLPFVLFEMTLRLCGYGYNTELITSVPDVATPTTCQFNADAGRAYYSQQGLSGPEPRHFNIPKHEGVFRIVVVGGSTVAGFPYPFELSFPRHLEVILELQLPDQRFEILNAGITSINSFSEVDVVRQVLRSEPDLIVVHSGHNEFYGPGGSASTSSNLAPAIYPFMQALRRQRSFQLVSSLASVQANSHLISTLPADVSIPLGGEVYQATQSRYRNNLRKIVDLAERADVPLMLSTVPANLRDLSPLQPASSAELTEQETEERDSNLKLAMKHVSYKRFAAALEALRQAEQIDPHHPLLVYRQAQCLEMLNEFNEAAKAYALAADLDGCRFRAPSSFAEIVQEVVSSRPHGVYFCDVKSHFESISQYAAPGNDLFLEHVHYNLEGHWQAATSLAKCIVSDVLNESWKPNRLPDDRRRDGLLHVTAFDHLVADAQTIGILEVWPFTLSPAHQDEAKVVVDRWRSTYTELPKLDQQLFTNQSLENMAQNVLVVMGYAYLSADRESLALGSFQRHIARRPWDTAGYIGAVLTLRSQGNLTEAQKVLEQASEIFPRIREMLVIPLSEK